MMAADVPVRSVDYTDNENQNFIINYYLKCYNKVFGVTVEKMGSKEVLLESTGGLTSDKESVMSLIERLAAGVVTPMTLLEIVDDLSGDHFGI